jgi:hypothetical protein
LELNQPANENSLHFKQNNFSNNGGKIHFTPIWFPDGDYKLYAYIRDAWTPAGELKINITESIKISGNLYQDWHVGQK